MLEIEDAVFGKGVLESCWDGFLAWNVDLTFLWIAAYLVLHLKILLKWVDIVWVYLSDRTLSN